MDAKIRFWPFALASVGTGGWSDALFSYAGSKSTVFWAKDAFLKLLDSRSTVLYSRSLASRSRAYGLWAEIGRFYATVSRRSLH